MNIVNLITWGDGRRIVLEADETTDEIVAIGYENPTSVPWPVTVTWKNKTDEYVIPAGTPYSTIGIPPGQRRWIPPPGGTGTGPFDSDLTGVWG
jgi:hypothetical protein